VRGDSLSGSGAAVIGSSAAFVAGGIWGVTIFSWGLPFPMELRIASTALLIIVLAAASRAGCVSAGTFALGMAATSGVLLAASGELISPWGLVPLAALASGVSLVVRAILSD
jgi:hypothetical protein